MGSFLTAINANKMTPQDVSRTFVPSPVFWGLLHKENSIVVGPRGSGKTTLLKMLQIAALSSWEHSQAPRALESLDFTGVFVPADRLWHEEFIVASANMRKDWAERFGVASFSYQVLGAFVQAAGVAFSRQSGEQGSEEEASSATQIALALGFENVFPSMRGLALQCELQRAWIGDSVRRIGFLGDHDAESIQLVRDSRLDISVFEVIPAIATILTNCGLNVSTWGLLFDELEIAPGGTVRALFSRLRGYDSRFVFKLALNPNTPELRGLRNLLDAQEHQDFEIFSLSFGRKEMGYGFSESLVRSLLTRRDLAESPETVFLRSANDNDGGQAGYGPTSDNVRMLRRLSKIDPSFRAYLADQNVALERVDKLSENKRAEVVRKCVRVAGIRAQFLNKSGIRSLSIYTGVPELYAICEGNPRWTIGLVQRLLDKQLVSSGADGLVAARVSRPDQADEIRRLIGEYRAFLRSVPLPPGADWGNRGLVGFLDSVGKFFADEVLGANFNPEPPLSFVVDSNVDNRMLELIGVAVSVGALVPVEDQSKGSVLGAAAGGRYRLSYLLAPHFMLPTILGRSVSLSSVLKRGRPDVPVGETLLSMLEGVDNDPR